MVIDLRVPKVEIQLIKIIYMNGQDLYHLPAECVFTPNKQKKMIPGLQSLKRWWTYRSISCSSAHALQNVCTIGLL